MLIDALEAIDEGTHQGVWSNSRERVHCRRRQDSPMGNLGHGTGRALLVAAGGAGGADDNHASTLAAVLVGRHVGDGLFWCAW